MIRAGIIGSTGYARGELAKFLLQRDDIGVRWYGSKSYIDQKYASICRNMFRVVDDACMDDNMKELADQVDVVFAVTPQGLCASLMDEDVSSKVKVIDLSADFRIKDMSVYERQYKLTHTSPRFIDEAMYGLPEINREKVKRARLIANPGCFLTYSFLSTYPLVKEGLINLNTIVIDTKSGTSGAGRGGKVGGLHCEINENIGAYGVVSHRYAPEIEEQLSCAAGRPVTISFTPHLVPMSRGILVAAYTSLTKKMSYEEIEVVYDKYYRDECFVRVLEKDVVPQTRQVEGSSFADVNFKIDTRTSRVVMMGAIDNMVKGAAGQAIQNMNPIFGLSEDTRLKQIPVFPWWLRVLVQIYPSKDKRGKKRGNISSWRVRWISLSAK